MTRQTAKVIRRSWLKFSASFFIVLLHNVTQLCLSSGRLGSPSSGVKKKNKKNTKHGCHSKLSPKVQDSTFPSVSPARTIWRKERLVWLRKLKGSDCTRLISEMVKCKHQFRQTDHHLPWRVQAAFFLACCSSLKLKTTMRGTA